MFDYFRCVHPYLNYMRIARSNFVNSFCVICNTVLLLYLPTPFLCHLIEILEQDNSILRIFQVDSPFDHLLGTFHHVTYFEDQRDYQTHVIVLFRQKTEQKHALHKYLFPMKGDK